MFTTSYRASNSRLVAGVTIALSVATLFGIMLGTLAQRWPS